jgi:putative DNA primase/helicase
LALRWRTPLRGGWAAAVPVLHLDATMQDALVRPYLPFLRLHEPVSAVTPHMHVRQVLGSPTTAKALTPDERARERDHTAARNHLRDLQAYIALRAREFRRNGSETDVLVVGQKAAIDQLRDAGLPPRTDAVHFNALSGLDRWGEVACLIILGRTLPAPATVGTLAAALTGRVPLPAGGDIGWPPRQPIGARRPVPFPYQLRRPSHDRSNHPCF